MGVDFSSDVYLRAFDVFARPITVTPIKSQPGQPAYSARGIFRTYPLDVIAADGSIISEQRTELDIREIEFSIIPEQFDVINIPVDPESPDKGNWEIKESSTNGGGETTLTIRKIGIAKP